MQNSPEAEPHIDAPSDPKQLEALKRTGKSHQKSIFAWAVFALGLNAAAAVYTTSPADFALPNVGALAELLPHQKPADMMQDPVVLAALKDMQSTQSQDVALLQENNSSLQQNTALLQQDSTVLSSLRASITDQQGDVKKIFAEVTDAHGDVKKVSSQLSTLIAKVDSLQNAIAPEFTSSIPKGRARAHMSGLMHNKMVRVSKPAGPVSIGGAPLTTEPAVLSETPQSPES